MGCSESRPPTFNVIHEYTQVKLTVPNNTEYENDFEKEAFMMINLIRHEPKKFVTHVKLMKSKSTAPIFEFHRIFCKSIQIKL